MEQVPMGINANYIFFEAYHSWREALLVNSNWFIVTRDHPNTPKELITEGSPARKNGQTTAWQIRRASETISAMLDYKDLLDHELLPPEGSRAGPMCMNQYRLMYGITRVPKPGCDVLVGSHPAPARHIIVLIRDQIYAVDVVDERGRISIEDIEKQLQKAVRDSTSTKAEPAVGLLTSEHRDTWAQVHKQLEDLSPDNQYSFSVIESALFAVSLDDYCLPLTTDNLSKSTFHGMTAHNRWFDKCMSVCVMNDGRVGLMGEHSPCDALIPATVFEYVANHEPVQDPKNVVSKPDLRAPMKMTWKVDAAVIKAIDVAGKSAKKIIDNSDVTVLRFTEFGSDFVKSKAKVSPDAFSQMAMQLAYYRMHKLVTATYETVLTRKFLHGRTECCRSCSVDSKAFCVLMDDQTVTASEKLAALRKACDSHVEYVTAASNGKGVDRHLMGLRVLMQEGESAAIFKDPAYSKSNDFRLSTSGLFPGERMLGSGFGAVCEDGYGINYMVAPKLIKYGIESKFSCPQTSSSKFAKHLACALIDMKTLYTEGSLMLERVEAMLRAISPESNDDIIMTEFMDGIHIYNAYDYLEQVAVVELLYEYIAQHPKIKLIVLDSISFHTRQGVTDVSLRSKLLHAMSSNLVKCAEKYKVAVLVTNQVTTKFNKDSASKQQMPSVLVPSLGDSWGNGCNQRVIVFWKNGIRTAVLTKSSNMRDQTVTFTITADGIRDGTVKTPEPSRPRYTNQQQYQQGGSRHQSMSI
ncbi:hypothetical protein SmJEL517_g05790 [Synchytrium microbalum]|uniref:RecA family profile 1 domain-containing protein n=1 Tax=Synchytrium microbalum TaxID=1806994 RepID=A0A507BTQ8_9FUNG|nr:uncharacterized protein SmJEL517_g05790 [Synchytrium microbalum]TPX30708.1 hypothetical protein SmJEL517_g05790 [Synchytrium microbalum]